MDLLAKHRARLKDLEADFNRQSGQVTQLYDEFNSLESNIRQIKSVSLLYEESRILLQKAGTDARESARKRLEETVTEALKYVFGPDFEFIIELRDARGRTEADFYVQSEYNGEKVKTKPEDSRGGGVIDIISIALRIALIQIHNNPAIKGPIILDEPGKHVSVDYATKLATFLKHINQTFNRQIIISTHQPDLANIADQSHYVEIRGGKSIVTKQ
jgi:DNA repair exonuclease SbcCD ATPase subunit